MIIHKLVAFTPSNDLNMRSIVQEGLEYVNNNLGVNIEHVTEEDSRLTKYSRYPSRFPAYMLFKDDILKTYIHAKLYPEELLRWVISKSG